MTPLAYGFIIAASIVAATMVPVAAITYEPSESIQRGSYRLAAGKGTSECIKIPNGGVVIVPHGFLINDSQEFVPQDESRPSTDGSFWRCGSANQRQLFLVPLNRY